jgi:hypothetical protein
MKGGVVLGDNGGLFGPVGVGKFSQSSPEGNGRTFLFFLQRYCFLTLFLLMDKGSP